MPNPVKIVAILAARPGKTNELKALVLGMVAASRAEPGNLRWDVWQDQAETGRFVLDELYMDNAAVACASRNAAFQGLSRADQRPRRTNGAGARSRRSRKGVLTWRHPPLIGLFISLFQPRASRRDVLIGAAENLEANQAIVARVRELAAEKGASPGQLALAWLLAQQPWIVPIPGTRRLSRLEENAGATTVGLSADERAELDRLVDSVGVAGNRYNDAGMAMVAR